MFDGEIVKKNFPFEKILDLENFQSKTKLDLANFHQFFLAKSLKMSCLMEKFPFKKILHLENDRVQDKVGLRKFSPIFCLFFFLQKALKCHV